MGSASKVQQSKVHLSLTGEFDAVQLERIIRELALARSDMLPQVAVEPPSLLGDSETLLQEDAQLAYFRTLDGKVCLWLRNEGLGWLLYVLSAQDALALREFLTSRHAGSYTEN